MARSVRTGLVALAGAAALAGCTTTQHAAQRERLDSARNRAALESTRVAVANTVVTPTSIAEVRAGGKTAFIVTVRNRSRRAVTDLPISVGYSRPNGTMTYLNSAADLDYFQAHLPAIRSGRTLTWVYTAGRVLPAEARPFARVGLRRSAPAQLTETNVSIGLSYRYNESQRSLKVHLNNQTSVPQYQLQVYVYAKRDGRYVGAANATVMDLGAGTRETFHLGLVGGAGNQLHVQAVPTILQ